MWKVSLPSFPFWEACFHATLDRSWMDFPMACCVGTIRGEVPPPSHAVVPFVCVKNKTIHLFLTDWMLPLS